jgi:Domain of unknown function (DUF4282)
MSTPPPYPPQQPDEPTGPQYGQPTTPHPIPPQSGQPPQGQYGQTPPHAAYGQPNASGGPHASATAQGKGLIGALFDLSFRYFATPHIVRIVYILAMVAIGLGALGSVLTAFVMMGNRQAGPGFLLLIATPIVALLYLALARMTMELYVAVTRTAEELSRIRDELGRR